MAVQIYNQTFYTGRKMYENDADVRNRALEEINKFFFHHDSVDVVNIIEQWETDNDLLRLIVYYKGYI